MYQRATLYNVITSITVYTIGYDKIQYSYLLGTVIYSRMYLSPLRLCDSTWGGILYILRGVIISPPPY